MAAPISGVTIQWLPFSSLSCSRFGSRRVEGELTFATVFLCGNDAGTQAHEEYTVFLVLGAKFGCDYIERAFVDAVRWGDSQIRVADELKVAVARGHGDDLFGAALEDQGREEVVQMDVSNDVDLE